MATGSAWRSGTAPANYCRWIPVRCIRCSAGYSEPVSTCSSSPEPLGFSVAIRNRSGELLQVDTGSLYPALHRLEKQKWIAADWRISENKQRAKFYRLTASGKKQLSKERSKWAQLSDAIAGVLQPEE